MQNEELIETDIDFGIYPALATNRNQDSEGTGGFRIYVAKREREFLDPKPSTKRESENIRIPDQMDLLFYPGKEIKDIH